MKPRYDHTIRWLHYTSNCNFPLWKLKELRVKVVSIFSVDQLAYWLHTQGAVVHSLSPCQSSQVRSIGVRHWEKITAPVLDHFPQKMTKKWFPVPGFIGFVIWIAGFFIQDCVLFLSKRNLITRYPVIFNFRVGTGRVLEKKFGTGRVPGSRRTLSVCDSQYTQPISKETQFAKLFIFYVVSKRRRQSAQVYS